MYARFVSKLLLFFALLLLAPCLATAAVHVVTDFGDVGTPGQLRTLIRTALPGDTILVPPGTIVLLGAAGEDANKIGDLDVDKDLTIIGAGPELSVIDGGGRDRIFDIASGELVISGLTLRNGDAGDGPGGAIWNRGVLALVDVAIDQNAASGGGGIFNSGPLTITSSTISRNTSIGITANGGGILSFDTATILNSTISNNQILSTSASALGGGICNVADMEIVNSTVSGNRADGVSGGGIFQASAAISLLLTNVTVAYNVIDADGTGLGSGGGGIGVMGPAVEAVNTLVARNVDGAGRRVDCTGDLQSLGHNLIETATTCNILGVTTGNIVGPRARIAPLRDNGGPTETHALRRRSPAVDAGDDAPCPPADQRGVSRPQDGDLDGTPRCDIGAYELVR